MGGEAQMTLWVLLGALAYVAGSVNFAIILFRVLGREDPRRHHSKNPGATNVYRQAGFFWAAAVLLLDVGRAFLVGLAAASWADPAAVSWLGLALLLGNRYPCFHGFKGGKGVANYLGFTLALSPAAALISGVVWVGTFFVFRLRLGAHPATVAGVAATVALIVYNHRNNILEKFET
jgi:glycerol-3-phosphate acyltransferase PlsY